MISTNRGLRLGLPLQKNGYVVAIPCGIAGGIAGMALQFVYIYNQTFPCNMTFHTRLTIMNHFCRRTV